MKLRFSALIQKFRNREVTFGLREAMVLAIVGIAIAIVAAVRNG